ncbi:xylosidase [Chitinophaga silvatica]|uniref:Xylosidase n=1 Tax=Chitinophaga silvatica TaxID=2282649 RepID=A0A3E1Y8S9_9BACT|nr:glycoside hydrolase family 71/99-like protein [Chitinophaga silvatica]RFS21817.1 xylosidase [Chitinophaga silvatica]
MAIRYLVITLLLVTFFSGTSLAQNKYRYPSYKGLVMAGYQGWFNAPGDSAGRGWYHYQRRGTFAPGSCEIDFWPDVREYSKTYQTAFSYADGKPASVFSANDESTVNLHFKWMKEYGLDGVFMQRFIAEIRNPSGKRHFNTVLQHAMKAAIKYDRAICVMYDLSGMRPGEEQTLLKDIDELDAEYGLLKGSKVPTYLHHNNKPLVVVWGVGFNDHRAYGLKEAETIVKALKEKGFSVMLGVPTYWRELRQDAVSDPVLHELIKQSDILMPWFVGRYNGGSYNQFKGLLAADVAWCKAAGVDYAPLAFPGFSWKNMNGPRANSTARERGAFYWQQIAAAKKAGAEMLYVAMFDEVNEGTAIFKCATVSNLPLNGEVGFVGIDDDLGSDYYLWLTGQAAKWFHGKKEFDENIPLRK